MSLFVWVGLAVTCWVLLDAVGVALWACACTIFRRGSR